MTSRGLIHNVKESMDITVQTMMNPDMRNNAEKKYEEFLKKAESAKEKLRSYVPRRVETPKKPPSYIRVLLTKLWEEVKNHALIRWEIRKEEARIRLAELKART